MTKEEKLINSILEAPSQDLYPLICAVQAVEELFPDLNNSKEMYTCTAKKIYERAAEKLQRKPQSVARQVQRLANKCWDAMAKEKKLNYIGKELEDIPKPIDIVIYLAYYIYYHRSYYEIMKLESFKEREIV